MRLRSFLLWFVMLPVSVSSYAGPFTIDDFSVDHPTLTTDLTATSAVNHPDILGGNRDIGLLISSSAPGVASVGVGEGIATFDGTGVSPDPPGLPVERVLVVFDYDGLTDDDAFELGAGLGGIDVTMGGLTNAIALDFLSLDYDVTLYHIFTIALWDTSNRHAFLGLENVDVRSASPFTLLFPFDLTGLTPSQSVVDTGFEFDSVGFVRIQLAGNQMAFHADGFRFASTGVASEPTSLGLLVFGAAGLLCHRRRRYCSK